MFGSSPTLLNTNCNSATHTSRSDAVLIQYRSGYTNLNDACPASSTSDVESFNGEKKTHYVRRPIPFEADFAHLTKASNRINNCLVRPEKVYISILCSISVFLGRACLLEAEVAFFTRKLLSGVLQFLFKKILFLGEVII